MTVQLTEELTRAYQQGITILAPAGVPNNITQNETPYWEIKGLANHPHIITIGAANQAATKIRNDSA